MNWTTIKARTNKPAFWIGIVGAAKLATDALGVEILSDEQVNTLANALAIVMSLIGVGATYAEGGSNAPAE